jgi:hypothetical protein
VVTPEQPDGVRLDIPAHNTLWGRIEFSLYVAPKEDKRRRVAVVGRAGTTIIDDLVELDEFSGAPWDSDQVSGQVVFEALRQTAGRRAILRDREAFPVFVDAVRAVEPVVARTLERVAREVDETTAERLADAIRRVFDRVLKELADIDNPMRALVGSSNGEGALLVDEATQREPATPDAEPSTPPDLAQLSSDPPPEPSPPESGAGPDRDRSRRLPALARDPDPGEARSRFDPVDKVVLYNDGHPDYLLVKDDEVALLDYLATLVAKEYVVYNNPRASTPDVAEEMVRMLVRVRRHLPRRR